MAKDLIGILEEAKQEIPPKLRDLAAAAGGGRGGTYYFYYFYILSACWKCFDMFFFVFH